KSKCRERPERRRAELRQQAREEHGHLAVAEVAEKSVTTRPACTPAVRLRRGCARPAQCPQERFRAEEDEVGGSEDPDRGEGGLRCAKESRDSGSRRERPRCLSQRD